MNIEKLVEILELLLIEESINDILNKWKNTCLK